jgi:glycosyltransferase involved in cell wall biosynthesis
MDLKLAIVSHQSLSTLGGISVHIRQLAEALVKLGVDVEVIVPASGLIRQSPSYLFSVTPIQLNSMLQTMRTLEYNYKVYRYLTENWMKFDAVHGSQWCNLFITAHKKELKIPIITKIHGTTFHLLRDAISYKPPCIYSDINWFIIAPLYAWMESSIIRASDGIICISRYVLKEVLHLISSKGQQRNFAVIYNGVNHELFRPQRQEYIHEVRQKIGLGENDKCILYVGRVEPMKGLHYLVRSMKKLSKTIHGLKLIIVGDLNENPSYTKYLFQLAKPNRNIIFIRKMHHRCMPLIYNACDVFVSPSLYEALGNTILEAMACGKPVVASNVGGLKELIKPCETGFLVDIQDIEEQLIKYLTILLSDDDLARKMGENGYKFTVKNFSWERTAIQTINFIEEMISS